MVFVFLVAFSFSGSTLNGHKKCITSPHFVVGCKVQALANAAADPDRADRDGRTPLRAAVAAGGLSVLVVCLCPSVDC